MATWLHRITGLGGLPRSVRRLARSEGVREIAEGVRGSMTTRNFRAPGRANNFRREGFLGSVVITGQRLMAYSWRRRQINIGLDDPALAALEVSVPRPGILLLAFDAGAFQPDWSGRVEFRFHTERAALFREHLVAAGATRLDQDASAD